MTIVTGEGSQQRQAERRDIEREQILGMITVGSDITSLITLRLLARYHHELVELRSEVERLRNQVGENRSVN